MDFIFMLTHHDRTVADCLAVLESIKDLGIRHVGFKDIGADQATMHELTRRIRAGGCTSYLEIVATDPDTVLASARLGMDIGIDRVLGGTRVDEILEIVGATPVRFYPFAGRPVGHPTRLYGSASDIADDTRRLCALGCAGVDLLAYRAQEADPLELIRAARHAMDGELIIAGSIDSIDRIRAIADAGADAFTVGSAVFERAFAPGHDDIRAQLMRILAACAPA